MRAGINLKMKTLTSDLTLSTKTLPSAVPPPRLDLARVLNCEPFHYPWDDWERWALAQGLDPSVVGQARLLIREAFNHDWPEELRVLCGWSDDGQALLALAQRAPKKALGQWNVLMRADGFRGDVHPETQEWTWGYLQPDAKRLLTQLTTRNS